MMEILRKAVGQTRLLVPAAIVAWLVTLLAALTGAIVSAVARDSSSIGELATLYVPAMSIPFAFSTAVVLLPLMALIREIAGADRPWLLGFVGVAAAPVQGLLLLASGRMVFRGSPRIRPTFGADLVAIASQPADAAVLLAAFAAGGITLGMWAAKLRRRNIGQTPAPHRQETAPSTPTRSCAS